MAVVALGLVGASIGGAAAGTVATIGTFAVTGALIGQTIGAFAGGVIDSYFLFPAIFGNGNQGIVGPRLESTSIQTASEGSDIKRCFGPLNRFAGTIIFTSGLIEEEVEEGGGGKGGGSGGGATSTGYLYYVDIAVGVCEGPISRIRKVWADAKVIYDNGQQLATRTVPSVQLTAATLSVLAADSSFNDSGNGFAGLVVGGIVRTSGFTHIENNSSFKITSKPSNGKIIVDRYYPYNGTTTASGLVNEAVGRTVTLVQESYDVASYDSRYEHIAFYKGTELQNPNALIESYKGAGNVPGYRGTAYVVFRRLALRDFGNRIPQFTFLVEEEATKTVGEAISDILVSAGRDPSEFDVSRVPGCLQGYYISGPVEAAKALEPLMMTYQLLAQQSNNVLTFFAKGDELESSATAVDLAAGEPEPDNDKPFKIEDTSNFNLPGKVVVTYIDPDNDFQQGSQSFTKLDAPGDGTVEINVPMTMTTVQAQDLARRVLWQLWTERQSVTLSLPPQYFDRLEGEVIRVPFGSQIISVRIETITQGANYLNRMSGLITESETAQINDDDQSDFDDDVPDDGGGPIIPQPYTPPALTTAFFDVPAIRDSDTVQAGLYYGVCATDPVAQWRGATIHQSTDDANFLPAFSTTTESRLGIAQTALGSCHQGYWDLKSTVDVKMLQGELASTTQRSVLGGDNLAILGNEIIGFVNAEYLGNRTYRLSTLLRGLRCTHDAISNHTGGEYFLRVPPSQVQFWSYASGSIGSSKYLRPVPTGGGIADFDSIQQTLSGSTLKQFAPAQVTGSRDSTTNDLTISWTRRSRAMTRIFGPGEGPILADQEEYEVDVLSEDGVLLRTINVTNAQTCTYTAAQQTADSYTVGLGVVVEIFQMNAVVGRGFASERIIL